MLLVQSKFRLFDLFGIPIYLDLSLVILLLFFLGGGGSVWSGILCALMLLASITLHELGHALTARAFGYQTRDITLSLLGGCASLIALPRKAYQEFLTAIAGPMVSVAICVLAMVGLNALSVEGSIVDGFTELSVEGNVVELVWKSIVGTVQVGKLPNCPDLLFFLDGEEPLFVCKASAYHLFDVLFYLSVMNLMLAMFNMLPGFPMDGGRVFRSAMRPFMSRVKATYIAMVVGRVVAVGIGLRGIWSLVHGGDWGFVTLLIAWMIWREGYREYVMARMESSWQYADYRAKVSPPPYGGEGDERDVDRF